MNNSADRRKRNRNLERRRRLLALMSVLILLAAACVILVVILVLGPGRSEAETLAVDSGAVASLEEAQTRDVGSVVQAINERDAAYQSSVQESQSIEESVRQSSEMESMALASSVEASAYESSAAEAAKNAMYAAVCAPLAGSHIVPGEVSYDLDDSDIPYIRSLFSNCIVIGNSRAKNAVDCGILTDNEVKYLSGKPVDEATPFCLQCAALYKPKTLFIFGLNDVAHYDCNAEQFKADYTSMIRQYLAINPTSEIYVQESLPLADDAWNYFYRAMTQLPNFNAAIKSMCEENGWHFVSASKYADQSLINSEDRAHYGKTFYFLWAQTIAEQMHLYEDLAGLPSDIDWEPY